VKAGAVNSKSFVTHGAADVVKIVGVRQEKSDAKNTHRTIVSVLLLPVLNFVTHHTLAHFSLHVAYSGLSWWRGGELVECRTNVS